MSAEVINPEFHDPNVVEMDADKALAIAEQANLDPESLNGFKEISLIGNSRTFVTRSLQRMGENGPIALIRTGNSITKLYDFDVNTGSSLEKHFALTGAAANNDVLEEKLYGQSFLTGRLRVGSRMEKAGLLGLAGDERTAAAHFDIEADNVQVEITDLSQFNKDEDTKVGTYVIINEVKYDPGQLVNVLRAKQIGKPILSAESK